MPNRPSWWMSSLPWPIPLLTGGPVRLVRRGTSEWPSDTYVYPVYWACSNPDAINIKLTVSSKNALWMAYLVSGPEEVADAIPVCPFRRLPIDLVPFQCRRVGT